MSGLLTVHLGRLRTMPALRVLTRGHDSTRLAVDGLVCGVCAARTSAALAAVPSVRSVRVDLNHGTADIEHEPGARLDDASLQRALDSVVVAKSVRRWLSDGLRWQAGRQRSVCS